MHEYKLGDIAFERKETCKDDKDNYPIVGLEHLIPEQVILTEWDQTSENTFTKLFRAGDILFGRRRAYLKKAAVAPFDGICSGDITVIAAKEDVLSPRLLPFIIQNDMLFDYAVKMSAGGLSPRVKWQNLKDFIVVLPDMEKQEELAELLWSMEYTKRAYRKMIAQTDELVKTQFIEMFGDPQDNPKGWHVCTLNDVMKASASNGFFAKPKDYCEDGNAGIICVGDVVNRKYSNISSLRRANASEKEFAKYHVEYGDMLFCRSALANEGIAKASIVPKTEATDLLFECHVIRIPLDMEMVIPEFMQAYSTTDYFRQQMMDKSKTATMTTIGQKDVITGIIYVPPLELQMEFVNFAEQSDKSKFELQKALDEMTAMQKKIIEQNLT